MIPDLPQDRRLRVTGWHPHPTDTPAVWWARGTDLGRTVNMPTIFDQVAATPQAHAELSRFLKRRVQWDLVSKAVLMIPRPGEGTIFEYLNAGYTMRARRLPGVLDLCCWKHPTPTQETTHAR